MDFSEIPEKPIIFFSWVTALGLLISLTEATIRIKIEKKNTNLRREKLIKKLYPKKLA